MPQPVTSVLNFTPGTVVPNLATASCWDCIPGRSLPMITVYNGAPAPVHVVVDLSGVFDDGTMPNGLRSHGVAAPTRVADSRIGLGGLRRFGPGSAQTVKVPEPLAVYSTMAVVTNSIAVTPTASTYLSLFHGGTTWPGTSNLNAAAGQTVANGTITEVGNANDVSIRNFAGSCDVVVDISGSFDIYPQLPDGVAPPAAAARVSVELGIDRLEKIAASDPRARQTCMWLDAALGAMPGKNWPRAKQILEQLLAEGYDPSIDPFLSRYFGGSTVSMDITDVTNVTVCPDKDVLGLLVAELRQDAHDLAGAIALVEWLTPSTLTAVSLAEMYAEAKRWPDVVDLTSGITCDDDLTAYLLVQRGAGLREMGHYDAAREALKAVVASKGRPPALRHLALVERGLTYMRDGKKAMARKDFERVMADDASYPGLWSYLTQLGC